MNRKIGNDWFVDLEAMTCRHRNSRILVKFSFKDDVFVTGEIVQMPLDLVRSWLKYREFCKLSKKNVEEAKEAFVEQLCKKKISKGSVGKNPYQRSMLTLLRNGFNRRHSAA